MYYSLLGRDLEQEVVPFVEDAGIGVLVWSPLAGVFLSGKYTRENPAPDGGRLNQFKLPPIDVEKGYEVQPFGVDVVSVQPTGVRTPFVEKLYALMPQTESDSPYDVFKQNIEAQIQQMFGGNAWGVLNPEDVAKVIVQAVLVRRPQTRYRVGLSGKIFIWVRRLLPDRAWDALMSRMFPMGQVSSSKNHKIGKIQNFSTMD